MSNLKRISVIGLGKLGLPLLLVFTSKGFRVIGYDINTVSINNLQSGIASIKEPQIQDLLNKYKSNVLVTMNEKKVTEDSNITFIVVPTPSKTDGSFSSLYIEQAITSLIPHLKNKNERHVIVITSTVSPGTMEHVIKPLLEKGTKKKVGSDIGLCYSPELIALGSVVHNITHPDLIFIGESDIQSGNLIELVRKKSVQMSRKLFVQIWINAEIIKLSLNAYITTKISFANMIARISGRIPGADSTVILNTIGQDSRVGVKYLKGGLGFGGPRCLAPRPSVLSPGR
jgi:UDPglucose 6-dehydrogenase